ncbi:CcdB family protein [Xylophilus sp. GW821-FHT01B05]
MPRFDVYANPDSSEKKQIPFFLDVQNGHLDGLSTRVVVPLWSAELLPVRAEGLHPEFEVAGQRVVMDTPSIAAVPAAILRRVVDNLAAQQLSVQNALDTLFGSY